MRVKDFFISNLRKDSEMKRPKDYLTIIIGKKKVVFK